MRIYSVMFESATVPLSLSSLTTWRGAAASFAAGLGLARSGRYVARFIEIIVFAILLALMALPAPARAQTVTVSSVTASPATVQPGQTVTFSANITASQNASRYPVVFSVIFNGQNVTQKLFYLTFMADAGTVQAYSWTVPAGTAAGTYSMRVAVFNPFWSRMLATKSAALTIAAATVGSGAAPVILQLPVVSGTAQVGHALASTTGTWTGATSFAYQWSGNKAPIAGATAATYVPVASDVGHTLTSTVVATGSPGAKSSATSAATVPIVAASPGSPPPVSGSVPFVALHTYYMSPTGSDSNIGTSPSTPWATPNHSVVCGDVIIAVAGSYNNDMSHFGTVSNCPSTTGGIDGEGGIAAAVMLCGGADITSCKVDCATAKCNGNPFAGPRAAININKSNWSVQGWSLTCDTVQFCEAMQTSAAGSSGCTANTVQTSFINNLAFNNGQGFDTQSCNSAFGPDYVAVVGNITQNSAQMNMAQNGICIAAIDVIAPGVSDTDTTHTHFYIYGNYSFNNIVPGCDKFYDGEDYMFDTLDFNGAQGVAVMANNYGWYAERNCINNTDGNRAPTKHPTLKEYQNTCTENNQRDAANPGGNNAELLQYFGGTSNYNYQIFNNILQSPYSTNPQTGSEILNALLVSASHSIQVGGQVRTGANNILNGTPTPARDAVGNRISTGTNTSANPMFKNISDLLTNHLGVPSCTGFVTTTACMGWNANTGTMMALSALDDLTPTASGMTGKGAQNATIVCDANVGDDLNTDYPTWLKGIVHLNWNGASITERGDLVTKPCGM